jgi:hypothetical protein
MVRVLEEFERLYVGWATGRYIHSCAVCPRAAGEDKVKPVIPTGANVETRSLFLP